MQDTKFASHTFLIDTRMLTHIHITKLKSASWPEINYKDTFDTHLHIFSKHIYDFRGLFCSFILYLSTTHPLIFLPVHMEFTHPNDGWTSPCMKLWWSQDYTPNASTMFSTTWQWLSFRCTPIKSTLIVLTMKVVLTFTSTAGGGCRQINVINIHRNHHLANK